MTARIMFAWERGSAYGHLMRDLPVADRLRDENCEIFFVVPDVRIAAELLSPRGYSFIASPAADVSSYSDRPPRTYADRLYRQGYGDPLTLLGMSEAWLRTMALVKPHVVYANYAPTAMLAADILGIPQYVAGTGWEVPPPVTPSPSLDPQDGATDENLRAHEAVLCEAINQVLGRYKAQPLRGIADLFSGKATALTTFRELDHYGLYFDRSGQCRPAEQYVGHIASRTAFEAAAWSDHGKPKRIFAYLRPSPSAQPVLSALGTLPPSLAEVICVMPGLTGEHRQAAGGRVRFHSRGVQLDDILRQSDLLINYGGAGTVCAALLAGVPLLLTPNTLERSVTAERVAALGAGVAADPGADAGALSGFIANLLEDPRYKHAAERFADKYRYVRHGAVTKIVREVLALA